MQRDPRPDGLDLQQAQLQRKDSYHTRTPSLSGSAILPPSQLVPEPAYIATSAAIQIVNSEYVSRGPTWFDTEVGDGPRLGVSPAALVQVNTFLDQMLFNFLKGARSTSIVALKPAITDVLKPRLAKDAIQGADEELKGYLIGGEDEELSDFHNSQEFKGERNLHRIFRTTRLRCMVYTRLGDMEEEDEEMYLEDESAQDGEDDRHRLSRDLGNVSPAAAIFLTSIIEFIGEQTLMIAAEASFNRLGVKKPTAEGTIIEVEEGDVEKLAFNTTLGRLWRSWKSRVRPTSMLSPRSSMRDLHGRKASISTDLASRTTSVSEGDESGYFDRAKRGTTVAEVLHEDREPADIPLPSPRGFPTERVVMSPVVRPREADEHKRPQSMIEFASPETLSADPEDDSATTSSTTSSEPDEPSTQKIPTQEISEIQPRPGHQRSTSLPIKPTPYLSPVSDTFETPTEGPDPFAEGADGRMEAEKEMPQLTEDARVVQTTGKPKSAVSTMYDGVIGSEREAVEAHEESSRDVSPVSELSDASDHNMTPQALNFKKTQPHGHQKVRGDHESHASTVSSEYSFGASDPAAPTGIFGPKKAKKEIVDSEDDYPTRGISADQMGDEAVSDEGTTSVSKNVASIAKVQGDRLRTYDETGKAVKRDIPVLYEDPSNQNVIFNPKAPTRRIQEGAATTVPTKSNVHGTPPPLTPLRELRDAAQDTSDEASSVAPSYEASRGDDFTPPPYPPKSSDSQRADVYSPIHSDQIKRKPAPTSVSGAERAAVQRVSPTSAGPRDSPHGRTSTSSSNRDGRTVTSNSPSSKISKIIGRESGDQVRANVVGRISSDTPEKLPIRYSKTPRTGDKELDFENLIKSDETIQYTLTPQNMREMENPDSPRWSDDTRPSIRAKTDMDRTRVSGESSTTSPTTKALKGLNGLRSNPTVGAAATEFSAPPKPAPLASTARVTPQGPVPKSPGGRTGVMPRDTSMKDDSTRDFADFIRSTGPPAAGPNQTVRAVSAADKQTRVGSSSPQQSQQPALTGKPLPRSAAERDPPVPMQAPGQPRPARKFPRFEARDAKGSKESNTAELAAFFRSSPPAGHSASTGPAQRVPQTNGLSNGRNIGSGTSLASTQDSFAPSKMTQSSANSKTGLLDSANRAMKNGIHLTGRNNDGGPVRKQRRVKDPYDLGTDDEEEEDTEAPAEQEEESMSDFLRNYNPPPESTTTREVPVSISTTSPPESTQKRSKSGGINFRDRIARNIAVVPDYRPLPPKESKESKKSSSKSPPPGNEKRQLAQASGPAPANNPSYPTPSHATRNGGGSNGYAPQLPALNPDSGPQPHLVSQNGTYRPTNASSGARVPSNGSKMASGKPKLQARDETKKRGGSESVSAMAEFLRDTEPPAPAGPIMMEPARAKSPEVNGNGGGGGVGGFGKMFGRKKKI